MIENDQQRPLPSHFVRYNYLQPSPLFTKEQIDYIESISKNFSDTDLAKIRAFEWFELNLNVNLMAEGSIPGLRHREGRGFVYVKRFMEAKYKKMMDIFLDHISQDFPIKDEGKCYMPLYRVTIPDGGQFHPIVFHGDLDAWRKRLLENAEIHHTLLGSFECGKFILSDSRSFEFSSIVVDRVKTKFYPENW